MLVVVDENEPLRIGNLPAEHIVVFPGKEAV
jgi:hypothetical protein